MGGVDIAALRWLTCTDGVPMTCPGLLPLVPASRSMAAKLAYIFVKEAHYFDDLER